jgi:hypothetical protein
MTVSEAAIKIEGLMEKDMALAKRIEDMRNNLMKKGKKIPYYRCLTPSPKFSNH